MDFHPTMSDLANKLSTVRSEALKGGFSESVIATRQATASLEFFARLRNVKIGGDWGVVLDTTVATKEAIVSEKPMVCKLSSICKYYDTESIVEELEKEKT